MSGKLFLISLISIVYCLSAKAQKIDTIVYYLKDNGFSIQPVKFKDSADFYRVILPADTSVDKNLFIVNDFYKDGKPKMMGKSTTQKYFVQLSGVCMEFFKNGRRKSVKNYEHNNPVGDVTQYFPNGKIYLTGKFDGNNKFFVNECRDSTGKVLAIDGNGHYIKYSGDFKNALEEGRVSNGLEDGEWHGRFNDTIKYVCTYSSGIVKGGTSYDKMGNAYPFTNKEVQPSFKGGIDLFYQFLATYIHYPKVAKENNVQGKVFLTFVIDKDGSLTDLKVARGIGSGCDEEAARVVKLSPPWTPGKLYGIPVRVWYTIPITFSLTAARR